MSKSQNSKQYDLEDRTLAFAKNVRSFGKRLPKTLANIEDGRQQAAGRGQPFDMLRASWQRSDDGGQRTERHRSESWQLAAGSWQIRLIRELGN